MAELTLESLAARVDALERKAERPGVIRLKNGIVALPGTGDREAALAALDDLNDYDFDAVREQDECDVRHAEGRE